ncbi:MAG: hypothetical protein ABIQ31_04515 [Ferruginibacter sp.]
MINQYEVAAYLADELPEINGNLKKITPALNVFKSIQCLSDYTRNKVMQHDLRVVKKCFEIADNIYFRGNGLVRDAIENVFVYSFSSLFNLTDRKEKKELQALVPMCLYTAYVHQVFKSGI